VGPTQQRYVRHHRDVEADHATPLASIRSFLEHARSVWLDRGPAVPATERPHARGIGSRGVSGPSQGNAAQVLVVSPFLFLYLISHFQLMLKFNSQN
jgi:hypothetical protein